MLQRVKNYYHLLTALFAINFYRNPAKKLFVIGVTGTDGKTTTTSLIYHILKTAGKNVAMISTVGAYIGDKTLDTGFHTTTPSSFFLQKYLKKVLRTSSLDASASLAAELPRSLSGSDTHPTRSSKSSRLDSIPFLVLEVTSHALDQNRVFGIPFQIGVLTNITHEHLDYHKNYEKYVKAKLKLLQKAKVAVINRDDKSYEVISDKLQVISGKKIITYGLRKEADVSLANFPFETNLLGDFNKQNALAAIAVAKEIGIGESLIRKALLSFVPPTGRQEVVYNKDFRVIIDFAHTPNAFEQILPAIKKITQNRVIHVFGSAGKRDFTKRSLMGKAAGKFDDIIILTAEDSRAESIEKINKEIKSGIMNYELGIMDDGKSLQKNKKYVFEIPDRKKAIEFAISLAEKGDTVVLTGKAGEKSMNLDGKTETPWDEFAVAKDAIKKKS